MALLFDLFPIAAFFIAFKFGDIFIATGVLIVAVIVQATVQWIKHRKLSPMMLTSAVLVLIFGGITLIFRNETFIQWKPTIAYWLFAAGFLISPLFNHGKTVVEQMLGEQFKLESHLWKKLNLIWVLFFIFLGAINLWLLYSFDLPTWVTWHSAALIGLTFIFMLGQGVWIANKLPAEPTPTDTHGNESSRSDSGSKP